MRKERRRRSGQRARRVSSIEYDVVPGEHPRPPVGSNGLGQDCLLERRCSAAIAPHAIQHPDERQRGQRDGLSSRGKRDIPSRCQQRKGNEDSPPSPRIATNTDDEGRERRTGEARTNQQPDSGG